MRSGVASELQAIFDGRTVGGLTDGQLLERFATSRAEDAEPAFAALVARHGPMVFGVCQSLLRNTHDAEDAFQATFLVLARKAGALWRHELLGPWLYGVAHHTARRLKDKNARRRRREAEAAMSVATYAGWPDRHEPRQANRDEIEALHEEIARLPQKYRTAIVLCHLQGLTHEEASRQLRRPVGTISARLSRARERLRGRLVRRGMALPAGVLAASLGTPRAQAMPAALAGSTVKIAMTVSTGLTTGVVPASIASLSQGVLRSMLCTKLTIISAAVFVLAAAATSVAVLGQQSAKRRPAAPQAVRAPQPDLTPAAAQNGPDDESPGESELIIRSATNLKRIAGGIHAYLFAHNSSFPPAAIYSADGKPLLSWRVAVLPYLGENEKALHAQFKLDEPWDSPHNKGLLAKMPKVLAPVVSRKGEDYATYYQAFVGKGALFEQDRTVTIADVTDGTSNTLMVAEALTPVPWTKPEDLTFAAGDPSSKLGGQFKDGFVAATADGALRFFKKSIDPRLLKEVITRNGGEVIDLSNAGEGIDIP
jgi:RNA polymerase sigma factor (sigma-70 family)